MSEHGSASSECAVVDGKVGRHTEDVLPIRLFGRKRSRRGLGMSGRASDVRREEDTLGSVLLMQPRVSLAVLPHDLLSVIFPFLYVEERISLRACCCKLRTFCATQHAWRGSLVFKTNFRYMKSPPHLSHLLTAMLGHDDKVYPGITSLEHEGGTGEKTKEFPPCLSVVSQRFPRLKRLALVRMRDVGELEPLKACTDLRCLSIEYMKLQSIEPVASMVSLQVLNLRNNKSPTIPALMKSLTNLSELYIVNNRVGTLDWISGMTKLRRLSLSQTRVHRISHLTSLRALEFLDLSETRVDSIVALSDMPALSVLDLSETKVDDLTPLSTLDTLTELTMEYAQLTDLSPLQRCYRLKRLFLSRSPVSDLLPLEGLTSLEALHLSGTRVTNVSPLSQLVGLRQLHLSDTNVADVSMLSNLTSLQELRLLNTHVTDVRGLSAVDIEIMEDSVMDVPEDSEPPLLVEPVDADALRDDYV